MSTIINSKISLRRDDLSNWISADPVLNEGELAIVVLSGGVENIKFGNGISSFSQLSYMYQSQFQSEQIKTTELRARSISQGYNTQSVPTSIATGIFTESYGNFGVTHGIEARVKEGDDYAFVWNGINGTTNDRYQSHGEGTFNINALSGLSGIYIGERNVFDILKEYCEKTEVYPILSSVNSELSNKVKIGKYDNSQYDLSNRNLSVVIIGDEDYYKLIAEEKQDNGILYVTSCDVLNAFDSPIIHVGEPILSNHAATKNYVEKLSHINYNTIVIDQMSSISLSNDRCLYEISGFNLSSYDVYLPVQDGKKISEVMLITHYENLSSVPQLTWKLHDTTCSINWSTIEGDAPIYGFKYLYNIRIIPCDNGSYSGIVETRKLVDNVNVYRKFSILNIELELLKLGLLDELDQFLEETTIPETNYKLKRFYDRANEINEDSVMFQAYFSSAKTALGLSDEDAEAILSKCVI